MPIPIESKDLITLISVIAAITGWFVNGFLNRKNEITKKRLDHRLPTLKSFFKLDSIIRNNPAPFTDPTFQPLVEEVFEEFELYGKFDEIKLFENFYKGCKDGNIEKANISLSELKKLVRLRIRKELEISN